MNKKKVLLTGEKSKLKNYINSVSAVGLVPVFNPDIDCDGLILTGGGDVSPCLYGKMFPSITEIDLERDCLEFYLIRKYLSKKKKILGICRGLQIINVYFGGTLKEDVSNLEIHSRQGQEFDKKHLNRSIIGTFCHKIYGAGFTSNSAHHQAIDTLGKHLTISAFSIDEVVEAIEGKNVFAVQFHPERMTEQATSQGKRIFEFYKRQLDLKG